MLYEVWVNDYKGGFVAIRTYHLLQALSVFAVVSETLAKGNTARLYKPSGEIFATQQGTL